MADAAMVPGASLFIWSSLPNVTAMTEGRLNTVEHFDSKAAVEQFVRGLPMKSAFYMAGWYMSNFQTFYQPKRVHYSHP